MRSIVCLVLFSLPVFHSYGQVVADFLMQPLACSSENIPLLNQSTGGTEFEWDFCESDVQQTPSVSAQDVVSGAVSLLDIKVVYDDRWYGFVCDGDGNKITRLDYGQSLANNPITSKLIDFNVATGIELVHTDDGWFGLAGNFDTHLLLLEFGASLSNEPVVTEVDVVLGTFGRIRSLRLVKEGSDYVAFVVDFDNALLTRVNFGTVITASVASVDQVDMNTAGRSIGLELFEDASSKYAFVTDFDNGTLLRADFGSSWLTTPASVVVQPVTIPVATANPTMLSSVYEGGNYFLFMTLNSGQLFRFNFGSDLSGLTPQVDDLGTFPELSEVRGMSAVRENGALSVIFTSFSTNKTYYGRFEDSGCPASTTFYSGSDPPFIQYSAAGDYPVTLRVNHRDIDASHKTLSVNVSALPAPTITVQVENKQCLGVPNIFALQSDLTISAYEWALGEGVTSTDAIANHLYTQPGRYQYRVDVTADNACNNIAQGEITVSDAPDFDPPAVAAICTNLTYIYTNQTSFDPAYEPTWQWLLDGAPASNDFDLSTVFAGDELEIQLGSSLGGCEGTVTKVIGTIGHEPAVTLMVENKQCLGQANVFALQSDQVISAYEWALGEGGLITDAIANHLYSQPGSYQYRVDVTGTNGCNNFSEGEITVSDAPDFDPPAVAGICTNQTYTFTNQTPFDPAYEPEWQWLIDGVPASNDFDLSTVFAGGEFEVQLEASLGGCQNSVTKAIGTIGEGPAVDFTVGNICAGTATVFTNTTTGDASSYTWTIDGDITTDEHATHTFPDPGSASAKLSALSSDGCENSKTETVQAFSLPVPDFFLDLPPFSCSGTPSQFHDTTPGPDDSNLQTWTWLLGDGATVNVQDPTHVYVLPGEYSVELTVVTDKGCSGQAVKDVIISESPAVDFIYSTPCVNTPVQFTSSGTAVDTWAWKIGSATSPSQNPTHTFNSPGDYPVELTVTAANNCPNVVTYSVHVPTVPTIDISISSACVETVSTLSATSSGSDEATVNYSWDVGGTVGDGEMIVHSFAEVGSFPVDLEVMTESGCIYEYTEDVVIHPIPVAGFTPLEQYGPSPLTVDFTNASIGATSYEWLFDDQGATSSDASPSFTYTQLGTYQVTLHATSDAGCTGSSYGIIHVIVPHADLVLEDLAFFTDPVSNLTKGILQITNNGNYPISAVDLTIDMGSGIIITERVEADIDPLGQASLATNSTLSFQSGEPGFICVTARIPNDENLNDNAECLTIGESSKLFETYPNPSDGHLSIQIVGAADEELYIEIVNGTGADAYSVIVDVHTGLNILELDLTTLSPGIYVLRMSTSSTGVTTQRIVIQP